MVHPTDYKPKLTWPLIGAALLVAALLSGLYLLQPPFLVATNNRATDAVMALAVSRPVSGAVAIVDVDEKSLSRYGRWPWPRQRMAQLLQAIKNQGAAGIGLDLLLAEPDSPPTRSASPSLGSLPPQPQGGDELLAETLGRGPFVLGYQFLFGKSSVSGPACQLHPPGVVWIDKAAAADKGPGLFAATSAVCNRVMFSEQVTRSGFLNAAADPDGVLRRVPLVIRYGEKVYPSLALALLMRYNDSDQIEILHREAGRLELLVAGTTIPVDTQGNLMVHFARRDPPTERISAADLLEGRVASRRLSRTLVIVGCSAAGLDTVYHTPAGPLLSHAELHAQVLDNLLIDRQVIRTGSYLFWEVLLGILLALAIAVTVARVGILASGSLSCALVTVTWCAMVVLFQERSELYSPLLPSLESLSCFLVLTVIKSRLGQQAASEAADSTLVLLKYSEQNLNSIINAVPDIIFRLDTKGRLTFLSPAIAKYTPAPELLLGRPIIDLVAPEDRPRAYHRINEKRTGERATHGLELRLQLPLREGGRDVVGQFSVTAEGIYQDGLPGAHRFLGTQGVIRDIAEQKKLEEQLLQAQKMEAIGNLAAGVAHDLNNILVGLVAYPDLLLLELPPDSPLRGKLSMIQRSGQKAADIVQDLLTLGRRGVSAQQVMNLNTVITEYLSSLEFQSVTREYPGVKLVCCLADDLLRVKGSRVHLTKVLTNMLNNAVEAMPAGGTVRVATCNRYLDRKLECYEEIPAGEFVCVSVADEGVGIAEEDLHRIFEPFFSKKSLRRSGSGLGMTVIWATVKDHGGYLDLQSREGEGTRIEIYLPATRQEQETVKEPVLENYLGNERVLVVDDAPEQSQVAVNMLTKLGYRVQAVASGEAAIAHLSREPADLVLLDMIMPGGLDGLETYERILEIRPGQKAVITSGYSESQRVKALQELGAGAYLAKPYTLEKIGMAVRQELDRA
jgi:two-component system, cell cycle sensor histidine kinase and response regulator CckA